MKQILIALVLAALLVTPAAAYTPPALAAIDQELAPVLPMLAGWQQTYHAANDSYWQGVATHDAIPSTGSPASPNNLGDRPTDQPGYTWSALWTAGKLPAQTAYRLRLDTYDGPDGHGYVVVIETSLGGIVYSKAINYGPEAWRGYDWTGMEPLL